MFETPPEPESSPLVNSKEFLMAPENREPITLTKGRLSCLLATAMVAGADLRKQLKAIYKNNNLDFKEAVRQALFLSAALERSWPGVCPTGMDHMAYSVEATLKQNSFDTDPLQQYADLIKKEAFSDAYPEGLDPGRCKMDFSNSPGMTVQYAGGNIGGNAGGCLFNDIKSADLDNILAGLLKSGPKGLNSTNQPKGDQNAPSDIRPEESTDLQ